MLMSWIVVGSDAFANINSATASNGTSVLTRERIFIVDRFNEKEIERNAEGSTSGVAVDRVPIGTVRRRKRRRGHTPRNDADLVVAVPLAASQKGPLTAEVHSPQQNHPPSTSGQPTSFNLCENNGTFVNGKCRCYFPFAGDRCADFACEHGLSVGPRYDPESTFFNRRCICDEDWAGEYCNIPIADQCNERGHYIRGRCKCHGYYFGPKCQYVGKCVLGKLQEGFCQCNYGYEGDYCDKIVCHHGYPDKANDSMSCVCPPRHSGQFCDECARIGDYILPYPNCTEERIPHRARMSREKTNYQLMARVLVIGVALLLLLLFLVAMCVLHWGRRRAERYDVNGVQLARERQRAEMKERMRLLALAIHAQTSGGAQRSQLDVPPGIDGDNGALLMLTANGGGSARR